MGHFSKDTFDSTKAGPPLWAILLKISTNKRRLVISCSYESLMPEYLNTNLACGQQLD